MNGAKVPVAYASFPVGLGDFARSSLVKLSAIFNPNEVPIRERTVLLNSAYYGQLATDPSLVTFFSGQRAPEIITDNELPKLGTFVPVEAPNLNAANATPNLMGFAVHRAAVVAKSRLPSDYNSALPGAGYGVVVTVTDPETGMAVMCTQYVQHTQGFAESRLSVLLGAGPGDTRGGLCIISS